MKTLVPLLRSLWPVLAVALAAGCDATSDTPAPATPTNPLENASYTLQYVDGMPPPATLQSPPTAPLSCTGASDRVDSTRYTYGVRLTLRGGAYRAVVQHLLFQGSRLDSTVLTGRYEVDGQTIGLISAANDTIVVAPVPSIDDPKQLLVFNPEGTFLKRPSNPASASGCKVIALGAPMAPAAAPALLPRHANGFAATLSATHVAAPAGAPSFALSPLPATFVVDKYSNVTLSRFDVVLDGSSATLNTNTSMTAETHRYAAFKNRIVLHRGTGSLVEIAITPTGALLKDVFLVGSTRHTLFGRVQR